MQPTLQALACVLIAYSLGASALNVAAGALDDAAGALDDAATPDAMPGEHASRRSLSSAFWTITSGEEYCELSNGGTCVTDGPGDYGADEACSVRAEQPFVLTATSFDVHWMSDALTVGGVEYDDNTGGPDNVPMAAGDVMTWSTNAYLHAAGFEVCAYPPPPPSPLLPPAASEWWTITTGEIHCHLSNDGACVTDGDGDYGDDEACSVRAEKPLMLSTTSFSTASILDKLAVGGVNYYETSPGPANVAMAAGDVMTWSTYGSGAGGFVVCASPTPPTPPPPPLLPPAASEWWTITTGENYCHLSNDGACVTDGPGDYEANEACSVRAEKPLMLYSTSFDIQSFGEDDQVTVGGVEYRGLQGPNGVSMAAGDVMTWSTNAYSHAAGFEVCASPAPPPPPPLLPPSPPTPPLPPLTPNQALVLPGYGTLQAAVDAISAGGELLLLDGVYTGSGDYVVEISKDLSIRALNARQAVLDGQGARRGIHIEKAEAIPTVYLMGLHITNGQGQGGDDVGENAGGGISVVESVVHVTQCVISQNQCPGLSHGGGVYLSHATGTFTDCEIFGNTASGQGGGVYQWYGSASFESCNLHDNLSNMMGGGFYLAAGTVTFLLSAISSNNADSGGGFVADGSSPKTAHFDSVVFDGNVVGGYSTSVQVSAVFISIDGSADDLTTSMKNCTWRNHDDTIAMISTVASIQWTCQLGQWSPLTGTIDATDFTGCAYLCPKGTIGASTNLTSASQCSSCPRSQHCPEQGMGEGIACPVGTYSPNLGSQSCLDCGPGRYNDRVGQESCTKCAPGSATATEGSITCTECATGEYAGGNGFAACKVCPSFSTTDAVGSTSIDDCQCAKGFYEIADITAGSKACNACPEGGTTSGAGSMSFNDCICDLGRFLSIEGNSATCPLCAALQYRHACHAYVHTCMCAYIHVTCVHTCIHACILVSSLHKACDALRSLIHYIHACIQVQGCTRVVHNARCWRHLGGSLRLHPGLLPGGQRNKPLLCGMRPNTHGLLNSGHHTGQHANQARRLALEQRHKHCA